MIAVADTSPICYLTLIGHVELLRALFARVAIPQAVLEELMDTDAPEEVRRWIATPQTWLDVHPVADKPVPSLRQLHAGERDAIKLAESLRAEWIILDDRPARRIAAERGLNVTGLLGILDESATRGLVDLAEALDRLRHTTFRASPRLFKLLLDRHKKGA